MHEAATRARPASIVGATHPNLFGLVAFQVDATTGGRASVARVSAIGQKRPFAHA